MADIDISQVRTVAYNINYGRIIRHSGLETIVPLAKAHEVARAIRQESPSEAVPSPSLHRQPG